MKLTDRFILGALALLPALSGPLVSEGRAQNRAAIVGAGSSSPVPLSVAPGEIITIFATGLSPTAVLPNPQGMPLPTMLAGISASVAVSSGSVALPLISVFAAPTCLNQVSPPCSSLTGVRLQIPFGIGVNVPGTSTVPISVRLVVSDQSGNSAAVDLTPFSDQIHVVAVTHADGSLVSRGAPAKGGEELVAYAVGLGLTSPQVGTGQITPSPPPHTTTPFAINYVFSPNAAPSRGLTSASSFSILGGLAGFPAPVFAGLSPGSVGLYQLNFIVPSPPSGTLTCDGVYSNLTVSFVGPASFDGAPICVAVP